MTDTTINAETIQNLDGVTSAQDWERHGKRRIYIDTPKLNGGRKWNGERACTAFLDLDANELVCMGDFAGAKTRNSSREILSRVAETVGVPYRER